VINVARALSNIVARASSYLRVELYQVCEWLLKLMKKTWHAL
jgi:hypothetical protein